MSLRSRPATAKTPTKLSSPIGYLSNVIYVQTLNGNVYFWNQSNGRIILVLCQEQATKIKHNIEVATKFGECSLEVAFNDLIGINGLRTSRCTKDIFESFGNLIASILGIGCTPTGLFNLNGIIVFIRDLPLKVDPGLSGLGSLYEIGNIRTLLPNIAQQSVLLDAAGYWNIEYIFLNGASPLQTGSGYIIGALLGARALLDNVLIAAAALVSELSADGIKGLATSLVQDIAIGVPIYNSIDILYANDAGK